VLREGRPIRLGAAKQRALLAILIDDEGVADRYATQLTAVTALGLSRQFKSGTEYDSPDCYDRGPLDLDPESSRWP
jgi:hypothetical protein